MEWRDKVREDYKDIISEEQIESNICYWNVIIGNLLKQQKEEIINSLKLEKKEIDNMKFLGDEDKQIEVQREMGWNECIEAILQGTTDEHKPCGEALHPESMNDKYFNKNTVKSENK